MTIKSVRKPLARFIRQFSVIFSASLERNEGASNVGETMSRREVLAALRSLTRATIVAVPPRSSRKAKLTRTHGLSFGICSEVITTSTARGSSLSISLRVRIASEIPPAADNVQKIGDQDNSLFLAVQELECHPSAVTLGCAFGRWESSRR